MILDGKFTISDGTGDTGLLDLIDSCASFNFMSSPMAKCLNWATKPDKTPFAVRISNKTVVHSSGIATGLVSSGV